MYPDGLLDRRHPFVKAAMWLVFTVAVVSTPVAGFNTLALFAAVAAGTAFLSGIRFGGAAVRCAAVTARFAACTVFIPFLPGVALWKAAAGPVRIVISSQGCLLWASSTVKFALIYFFTRVVFFDLREFPVFFMARCSARMPMPAVKRELYFLTIFCIIVLIIRACASS